LTWFQSNKEWGCYALPFMDDLTPADEQLLINAIATREGTTKQLAGWYGLTIPELQSFVEENKALLVRVREEAKASEEDTNAVTPSQLSDLWIGKKVERLSRYQVVADKLYEAAKDGTTDATVLRELRFYMVAAANELGQLLHRGSGESGIDSLSVDMQGVDIGDLK